MPVKLYAHTAVAMYNDSDTDNCAEGFTASNDTSSTCVFVCGGWRTTDAQNWAQSACYAYSAVEDKWSNAASMNIPRYWHGMTVYKGVFVCVAKRLGEEVSRI
jgi:hypothetical protein